MTGKWDNADELFALFQTEAHDRLASLADGLLSLESSATPDKLEAIRRDAHSIKGSARLLGYPAISELAHEMEDVLAGLREGREPVTPTIVDLLLEVCDGLRALIASAKEEHTDASRALASRLHSYAAAPGAEAVDESAAGVSEGAPAHRLEVGDAGPDAPQAIWVEPVPAVPGASAGERVEPALGDTAASGAVDVEARAEQEGATRGEAPALAGGVVRLEIEKIHELINSAGEVATGQVGVADRCQELMTLLKRVDVRIRRVGSAPARSGLSLTEFLLETQDELSLIAAELQDAIEHSGKQLELLQDQAMELAMFPARTVFGPLPRLVRDLCRSLNKEAELVVDDGGARLDKKVLERLAEPIRALIINAVDHGIETPRERRAAGKPSKGIIRLTTEQRGGQVVLEVVDDGRGIDVERVRDKAVGLGLVTAGRELDGAELANVLFRSGFSTAEQVSDVSGRGVGLDVVRDAIDYLKGSAEIDPRPGQGACFVLTLPITLSIVSAVVIGAGSQDFVLPVSAVEEIVAIGDGAVHGLGGRDVFDLRGRLLPLANLDSVLGISSPGWPAGEPVSGSDRRRGVVVTHAGRSAVLAVDTVSGHREVVVKPLGSFLPSLHYVSGASIFGEGRVVLVLDPAALLESIRHGTAAPLQAPPTPEAQAQAPRVLVVDDSFPVREVERSILENAGYEVTTAQDGDEALELARISRYEAVVTDVDMPRMDGLDLCGRLKGEFPTMPVIMVTSLSSEADRRRGLEVGASAYLTKGEFDQGILIQTLRSLVGSKTPGG